MVDTPARYLRHRCAEWRDVRIHPDCAWVWGTCIAHSTILGGHVGWTMLDEQSETLSLWSKLQCPFCGVELATLLTHG